MLLTGLIMMIAASACKKDKTTSDQEALNGSWELRSVLGIQVPNVDPNYKAGNGNIFQFKNGAFKRYAAGKAIDSGSYTLRKNEMKINNNTATHQLQVESKVYATNTLNLKLGGDKLVIFDGVIAADGSESTYEKQNIAIK